MKIFSNLAINFNQHQNNKQKKDVSFTSVKNGAALKRLLPYGIPDLYSPITLLDPKVAIELKNSNVFTAFIYSLLRPLREILPLRKVLRQKPSG